MDFSLTPDQVLIRDAVREVCARFPGQYWRDRGERRVPRAVRYAEMTRLGWLSVLPSREYGGGGQEASPRPASSWEEVHRSGGNANACHAQLYTMGALARHGNEGRSGAGCRRWPPVSFGSGVQDHRAGRGVRLTRIATRAERDGGDYVVTGQKTFISRAEQTDLMLLLAGPARLPRPIVPRACRFPRRPAGNGGTVETRRIPRCSTTTPTGLLFQVAGPGKST